MAPPSGSSGVGAMWYHPYLKNATCTSDPLGPPGGVSAAQDAVNFAVVLPAGSTGLSVRVTSGGVVLQTIPIVAGLNYASVPGIQLGAQMMEVADSSGNVVLTASGTVDVQADAADGDCSFNYEVVGLQ
jgi:glucan endo-1,3-alpha-glucosidase